LSSASINLLDLPLTKISGEFVKFDENKNVIFPQILKTFDTPYSLSSFQMYDGFYLNDKIIYIFNRIGDYVLYNLNKQIQIDGFNGFCVFGSVYFVFFKNKCLAIDTKTDTIKTVNLTIDNAQMDIIKVKQLTPQLFAVITSNPTTIFLFGLDSAGSIASSNDGDTVNINSFSYATFSNPTINVDLIYLEDELYLMGDDFTVILKMQIKDIIYLQTLKTYNYRYSPFQEFENTGIKFIRETQSFYQFYNTLYNSYIYITKDLRNYYLGRETVYLTPNICFKLQETKFYQITDILQSIFPFIETYHEINFKLETPYTTFKEFFIRIPEVQKPDYKHLNTVERIASLVIEARHDNGYGIWSYGILYNKNSYRILVRGTDFVFTIYSKNAMRIEELSLWQ
jgi:hypothetical protein